MEDPKISPSNSTPEGTATPATQIQRRRLRGYNLRSVATAVATAAVSFGLGHKASAQEVVIPQPSALETPTPVAPKQEFTMPEEVAVSDGGQAPAQEPTAGLLGHPAPLRYRLHLPAVLKYGRLYHDVSASPTATEVATNTPPAILTTATPDRTLVPNTPTPNTPVPTNTAIATARPTATETEAARIKEVVVKEMAKVRTSLSRALPVWVLGNKVSADGRSVKLAGISKDTDGTYYLQVEQADGTNRYVRNQDVVAPIVGDQLNSASEMPGGLIETITTGARDERIGLNLPNVVEVFGSKMYVGEGQNVAWTFDGSAAFTGGKSSMEAIGENGLKVAVVNDGTGHSLEF
ncbi:MAG: hypothetical protein ACMG6E_02350, partial [Candidatus Roizmanbacteria bacterium]